MRKNIYEISFFPVFEGVYKPSKVDNKGRASVPADVSEGIAGINGWYAAHLNQQGFPFRFRNRSIYLGDKVVATLEPVQHNERAPDERNLVHLVEADITVDITKLNRELHAKTMQIGGKTYLVGYTPFDWWLYFNRETKGLSDAQKLKWAVKNNYSKIKVDASGRIQINRFVQQLGLDGYLGFWGHGVNLFMGRPEFVLRGLSPTHSMDADRVTSQITPEQLELPYPLGYSSGPVFMIECPADLKQYEIFYVEKMPIAIHQRSARRHQRGNRMHPRGSKKHDSNLPTLSDLLSPNS